MIIEAAVALGSGLVANSLVLVAFCIDSVIEITSAAVLLWRLNVELRHGQSFAREAEKVASRMGGASLLLLAAYVVAAAGWKLWTRQGAEFSSWRFRSCTSCRAASWNSHSSLAAVR